MSATMDRAYLLADRYVREEMSAQRVNKPDAIETVADACGLAPGTLHNVFKRRLKNVEKVVLALEGFALRRLEQRAAQLRRDIGEMRESRMVVDPARLAELEAALDDVERWLKKG
jgi:hypothetical protein